MADGSKWTLDALHEYLLALINGNDIKYTGRFESQNREAANLAAAMKSEFEGVNKLRGALTDLSKDMILRTEANAQFDSIRAMNKASESQLATRIEQLEKRLNYGEGAQSGSKDTRQISMAQLGLIVAAGSIIAPIVVAFIVRSTTQ